MADSKECKTKEDFEKIIFDFSRAGMICIEVYRGAQLGMFDQLGTYDIPKTSQEIADDMQFKERYVREWLACMVTSGIVELDSDGNRYILPVERRPVFCQSTAITPLCGLPQVVGLANIQDHLNECFKKDGPAGVPAEYYDRFAEWQNAASLRDYNWDRLKIFLEEVPGLMQRLESGGLSILEIGCGLGHQTCLVAEKFPKCTFLGLDINREAVEKATEAASKRGLKNATFVAADACAMSKDWNDKFDYVFCIDTIHDLPKPSAGLSEAYRVLKPGGEFSLLDMNIHSHVKDNIGDPLAAYLYASSVSYCMSTALYYPDAEGVGTGWGKENMIKALEKVGFKNPTQKSDAELMDIHILSRK